MHKMEHLESKARRQQLESDRLENLARERAVAKKEAQEKRMQSKMRIMAIHDKVRSMRRPERCTT